MQLNINNRGIKRTLIGAGTILLLSVYFTIFRPWWEKTTNQEMNFADTQTEWPEKAYNFGDISEGETVAHTFYFKNTGEHPFVIRKVESGCGCTTAKYDLKPVKSGKEGKIEIEFNSSGRYGKQYKEISIFANVPQKKITLNFTANVK